MLLYEDHFKYSFHIIDNYYAITKLLLQANLDRNLKRIDTASTILSKLELN